MGNTKKIFDALLVLQYQSGNRKALSLLVNRHHLKLCKHAFWYTHDLDVAKDIAQDSWTIIIKKMGSLRDPDKFGSWALRIVTRKSLDYLNKSNRERNKLKSIHADSSAEIIAENNDPAIRALRKAIRELPQNQRQVLQLFYTEEYAIKEISTILEVSVGTVKSRLYHAREKLKTILKERS